MPSHEIRARPPRGGVVAAIRHDPDVVASFLEDAAHFPGGRADGVAAPDGEGAIAHLLRASARVLPVGAQSSLTGGATPDGGVVLTTSRLNRILDVGADSVRAQAGVALTDLDAALRRAGRYYPPVPTFMGATVGGIVATNAAGAATFRYGTTRDWVRSLTVVLANGEVLEVARGSTVAHHDGYFDIVSSNGAMRVPIPTYRMPRVPKLSAGYFAAAGMDLVDLFVGCEGTLGVVTEVELRVATTRPALALAFVPLADRHEALAFVDRLRHVDEISAIEHMDARCLSLLRDDGVDRKLGVAIPADSGIALLVTLELPAGMTADAAFDEIGRFGELETPLARFCRHLDREGVLDDVQIAVPGDAARAVQLLELREAVPAAVNARVGRAKQTIDSRIEKTAADMIVPFDRLNELLEVYDREFASRGLDAAVWGHISDGNLHPNVIPTSFADVEAGKEAIRACGRAVIRLGGSPLAEHGVGRNPVKQALLRELYGERGIEEMRAVKRALDPDFKLAPGVIFEQG